MIDIPSNECGKESPHIDESKEYFAVTPCEFMVYSKEKKCWYCLRTKLVVPGRISDVIDETNTLRLHVEGKPITIGKWGYAPTMDDILDFYNSGQYIEWLENEMSK